MFDFSKEKVTQGFEESLQRLGLDYVDVLQVRKVLEDIKVVVQF